jgi:hypothetical protein
MSELGFRYFAEAVGRSACDIDADAEPGRGVGYTIADSGRDQLDDGQPLDPPRRAARNPTFLPMIAAPVLQAVCLDVNNAHE